MADKHKALQLDLPGAPLCAHTVSVDAGKDGSWVLPGYFHPDIPTALGEIGEPTLEQARLAVKAGAHVKLVDISDKDAAAAREWQADQHAQAKNVLREARRSPDPEVADRATVEQQA
jgi:hypothetical protein